MSTFNGIDLILLMGLLICAYGWWHAAALLNLYRARLTIVEQERLLEKAPKAPTGNVKVVQGFTGRGEPTSAAIPVTVGLCIEAGCRLVEEHAGPHMGEHGMWG